MCTAVATAVRVDSDRLNDLGWRIRMWRVREGQSYFKMPSYLWDESIAVARAVGTRRAVRELGLNRDELKQCFVQP